jgi:hypothetical protein
MLNWHEDVRRAARSFSEESTRELGKMSPTELIKYIAREKRIFPRKYPGIKKLWIGGECVVFGKMRGGSIETVEKEISWRGFYTGVCKVIRGIGL